MDAKKSELSKLRQLGRSLGRLRVGFASHLGVIL